MSGAGDAGDGGRQHAAGAVAAGGHRGARRLQLRPPDALGQPRALIPPQATATRPPPPPPPPPPPAAARPPSNLSPLAPPLATYPCLSRPAAPPAARRPPPAATPSRRLPTSPTRLPLAAFSFTAVAPRKQRSSLGLARSSSLRRAARALPNVARASAVPAASGFFFSQRRCQGLVASTRPGPAVIHQYRSVRWPAPHAGE